MRQTACRAAWQTASADPSLPVGAASAFSIYKLFDKRKKRAPEGDMSGRSHIWGAVIVTVFGLVLGSLVSLPDPRLDLLGLFAHAGCCLVMGSDGRSLGTDHAFGRVSVMIRRREVRWQAVTDRGDICL